MKKSLYFLPLMAMVFTGCLSEDEEPDYVEWKKQNEEYVTKMEEAHRKRRESLHQGRSRVGTQ